MNSLNYENITKFFKYLEENNIEGIEEIMLQPSWGYVYITFNRIFDADYFYSMNYDDLCLSYNVLDAPYIVRCEYE